MNAEEQTKIVQFAEAEVNAKHWKKIADGLKEEIRQFIIKYGTKKEKTSSMEVEGYKIKVTEKSSTEMVSDIVYRIKAKPELRHVLKYSLAMGFHEIEELCTWIAKGKHVTPTADQIAEEVKRFTERYSIGVGVDVEKFKEAVTNKVISLEQTKEFFVESEGTPAVSVSKLK